MNNFFKFLSILILYLSFSNLSYSNENLYRSSNIIMQDLINVLVQIKKPKSLEVARNLKSVGLQNKSYDLIIRKSQFKHQKFTRYS